MMKHLFSFSVALLLLAPRCAAQWAPTNGPYGPLNIPAIITGDSVLLAPAPCGYFSKSDLSQHWQPDGTETFSTYTQRGDSLFFCNGSDLEVIDLQHVQNTPAVLSSVSYDRLACNDSCLYGIKMNYGISKSRNNGLTWMQINNGLPPVTIFTPGGPHTVYYPLCVATTPDFLFCGTYHGVYRNTVNPVVWQLSSTGLPDDTVTIIKNINDTVYAVMDKKLYRSADNGNSWNAFYTAASGITDLFRVNNTFYVSTVHHGIYSSANDGASWNAMNTGLTDLYVHTINYYASTLLCGTNSGGIFSYQGGQWLPGNTGMACSSIWSMAVNGNSVMASEQAGVYISAPADSWDTISPGVVHDYFAGLSTLHDTVFLSVGHVISSFPYDAHFLMYSINNGAAWNMLNGLPPFEGDDAYNLYSSGGRLYAFENDKMYYTDNLGSSWNDLSLPGSVCNAFNGFTVHHSVPFANACGNAQLLKLGSSMSWNLSNTGLPSDRPGDRLMSCDSALFSYVEVHGMYASFDDGATWSAATNGLVTNTGVNDFVSVGNRIFVTTNDNGVFTTGDYGQHWYPCNEGLLNKHALAITALNDTLYVSSSGGYAAGTTAGNGIWKRSIADITASVQEQQPALSIALFPNPAADQVRITANAGRIRSVQLFDLPGNLVLHIAAGGQQPFDVSGLPNGMYLVAITFEDNRRGTAKLVINR